MKKVALKVIYMKEEKGYLDHGANTRQKEHECTVMCHDIKASCISMGTKGLFIPKDGLYIPPHKIERIEYNEDDFPIEEEA